jgi:hypothetical protein
MCDYSLHNVATRPAKVGDKLVTTRFEHCMTRGLAAVGEPNVAVCLLPGTEIVFEKEVEYDRSFSMLPRGQLGARVARFRQVDIDKSHVHHDALEFPDGTVMLLTRLCDGQHATVLQLPVLPHATPAEPRPISVSA